jgi:hypothetical protein
MQLRASVTCRHGDLTPTRYCQSPICGICAKIVGSPSICAIPGPRERHRRTLPGFAIAADGKISPADGKRLADILELPEEWPPRPA